MALEIAIILVLVLANGVFAGTELAVLSAKKGRLQQSADDGNHSAAMALRMQEDPNRFLSAVQVGITLISTLTGAFGGASLAARLAPLIAQVELLQPYAETLALVLVVIAITYFSLVLGELVPKRIALLKPEGYATFIAQPMALIARLSSPIISLLSWSTQLVLRLLGLGDTPDERITEEDIRHLVAESVAGGEIEPHEELLIARVFNLTDRPVRHIMTPRHEVYMLDSAATLGEVLNDLLESGFSRFPVYRQTPDDIAGVTHVRDIFRLYRAEGEHALVGAAISPPTYVPESTRAFSLLTTFRKERRHIAIVIGELGGVEGIVTLEDVLEEIVGEIADEHDSADELAVVRREDGSMLVDGAMPVDDVRRLLDVDELPEEDIYRFDTLAGFVISQLGRIPVEGDKIEWGDWSFEVLDMDGLRVDKVLIASRATSDE